jgi:hypothetical protein
MTLEVVIHDYDIVKSHGHSMSGIMVCKDPD